MQGVFSDLYVVKGIGIGHENVSVYLLEPDFLHMADHIVLTVAEAMSLEPPSPVFVLVGAALKYSLKVIRGSAPQGSASFICLFQNLNWGKIYLNKWLILILVLYLTP